MKIILMGTGPFAVPSFDAIAAGRDEIAVVITKAPIIGSKKPPINPVEQWAKSLGLPLWYPASLKESVSLEQLESYKADLGIVCDYGQILNSRALQACRLGSVNLHGSLLPAHRGAAPVQWSLLTGDKNVGVSVIRMTTGLDAGPVLSDAETSIDANENASQLEARLAQLGIAPTIAALQMCRGCRDVTEFEALGTSQDDTKATRAPRLKKSDGQLDFRLSAEILDRIIRAMQPWPGTFADFQNTSSKRVRVIIHRAKVLSNTTTPVATNDVGRLQLLNTNFDSANSAETLEVCVATGDGWLVLNEVQVAGKKKIAARDFWQGYGRSGEPRFVLSEFTTLIS